MRKAQKGFTLIELIMVIVILGILAAFALPRFADLSGDAENAAMAGVLASVKSAAAIMHASALAGGETGSTGEVQAEGQYYALVNGYPDAGGAGTPAGTTGNGYGITDAAGITTTDFRVYYNNASAASATEVIVTINASTDAGATGKPCVRYIEAGGSSIPSITEGTFTFATATTSTCA